MLGASSSQMENRMIYRMILCAFVLMSCLFLSAAIAMAQAPNASVSGPAMGTNVVPSTAVQKQTEGRSVSKSVIMDQPSSMMGSALSAGAPGVEGAPGTESGQ
jgi:hypothetical protein